MGIFSTHAPKYWNAGLPVIPCNGKRAFLTGWQQFSERMPDGYEQTEWLRSHQDCNIGLPLGPVSRLCCVDIDTDDPDEIAMIKAVLPATPYERVGKKGMALIYRWDGQPNFKLKTPDGRQPLEFLGKGNQVILDPSIHPDTGEPYTASTILSDVLEDIPHLPSGFNKETLSRALGIVPTTKKSADSGIHQGARHNALISYAATLRNQGHAGEALHQMLSTRNSTFLPPLPVDEVASIAEWGDSIEGGDGFIRNDKGKIVATSQVNIRHAVDDLGIALRHDTFAGRDLIEGLPGHEGFLTDAAVRRLWFLIDTTYGFRPVHSFFWEVMLDLAQQNSFDPVCDELTRLQAEWDGIPRLDTWLPSYAKAEDTQYNRVVGRIMLIAAARRARQPGVKFDTMLVLMGDQGNGKSSACQILAGGAKRFTDHIPFNADAREVIEALSGIWLAEAGELHGLRNASAEKLKSFLSRTVDNGRAAYSRTTQAAPRRCIFVGTTNSHTFLTDSTGNRRFWPVHVGDFDLEALARDRDQLIGEAAYREAAGESIILPSELWQVAAVKQEDCRIENPTASALQDLLGEQTGRIRSTDVWQLLKIPLHQQAAMARVVSGAMQELGWEGGKHRFGGTNSERGYIKGAEREGRRVLISGPYGTAIPAPSQSERIL